MTDKPRDGGREPVVVIVDDDDLFRESLEQNLIESDFQVTPGFESAPLWHPCEQHAGSLV